MSERMTWDVVILSWNRARLTLEAVESAQSQLGVDVTIWVVDQGSNSEDLVILRQGLDELGSPHLEELGSNRGVGGGRNHGMRLGSAEFVACLDNDAVFESEVALQDAGRKLRMSGRLGALAFRILNATTSEDDLLSWVFPQALFSRRAQEMTVTRFCGAGHAIRRSALVETLWYDERLHFFWEETDLAYQLIERGYEISYSPQIRVLHKVSPENRVDWSNGRFRHQVRGALYLEWKYFRSLPRLAAKTVGYLLKGAANGLWRDALVGVTSGFRLMTKRRLLPPLSARSRRYVRSHDEVHRGSFWVRVRREAFGRLPGKTDD